MKGEYKFFSTGKYNCKVKAIRVGFCLDVKAATYSSQQECKEKPV